MAPFKFDFAGLPNEMHQICPPGKKKKLCQVSNQKFASGLKIPLDFQLLLRNDFCYYKKRLKKKGYFLSANYFAEIV